jgi:hypothetical protein
MNFNISTTANAVEGGSKFLPAGIHKCTFQGLSKDVINSQNGTTYNVMALNLDIEGHGAFTHNFFEPTSAERTTSMYGENPSQVEHFMIAIREILEACDPKFKDEIDNGKVNVSGSFDQVVKILQKLTAPYIGKEMEVKLVPGGKSNFNQIPGFPARITRNGALGIATRFIGAPDTLVFTNSEKKRIDAVANAKPTNMASQKTGDDLISGISLDLNSDNTVDDLPFD